MSVSLNLLKSPDEPSNAGGCGKSCGNGLEKIYPSTGVRYGAMNWIGEFTYRPGMVFSCGGKVVIQSDRGMEIGQQVSLTCSGCSKSVSREQLKSYVNNCGPEFYRLNSGRILREATPQDLEEQEHLNRTAQEDIDRCALIAAQLELDMKIVTVEHLLGGERIVFYFRSDVRIDFRDLVHELAAHYRTRIEMRQVGARDEARLVADYEICGRECCCKNFLKKLRPVSMKMAKVQKSTLDPSKVSGRCGRLRCCLRYEHEGYEVLAAKLPRVGARVGTSLGDATVVDRQILTQLVMVRTADDREVVLPVEELSALSVKSSPAGPLDDDRELDRDLPDAPAARALGSARPAPGRDGPRDRPRPYDRSRPPPRRDDPGDTPQREEPPAEPGPDSVADAQSADRDSSAAGRDGGGPRRSRRRRRGRGRRGDIRPEGGPGEAPPPAGPG
ncbi:MAG: stage 0 sporulation family protein [Phycisphaerae bacterium]